MVGAVEEYKVKLGIVPQPMVSIEPCIEHFRPFQENDDVDQTHNRKEDYGKTGISNHEIPRRNQNDMRQYSGAISMHDFQADVRLFLDNSSPRSLRQHLAD